MLISCFLWSVVYFTKEVNPRVAWPPGHGIIMQVIWDATMLRNFQLGLYVFQSSMFYITIGIYDLQNAM